MKYQIDFVGGTHGHFLEYMCNKYISNINVTNLFNSRGTSDNIEYDTPQEWVCDHYYDASRPDLDPAKPCVKIIYDESDLLRLYQTNLLRAGGGFNADLYSLHTNTYNKMHGTSHHNMIEELQRFNNVVESYNAVKDDTWPEVTSYEEFCKLPMHIRNECKELHNLEIIEFGPENPDFPEGTLREYFKQGFYNASVHGLLKLRDMLYNNVPSDTLYVKYRDFYDYSSFIKMLNDIALFVNGTFNAPADLNEIHEKFVSNNPYSYTDARVAQVLHAVRSSLEIDIPALTIVEQAYIEVELEKEYNVEVTTGTNAWFCATKDINRKINEVSN